MINTKETDAKLHGSASDDEVETNRRFERKLWINPLRTVLNLYWIILSIFLSHKRQREKRELCDIIEKVRQLTSDTRRSGLAL